MNENSGFIALSSDLLQSTSYDYEPFVLLKVLGSLSDLTSKGNNKTTLSFNTPVSTLYSCQKRSEKKVLFRH